MSLAGHINISDVYTFVDGDKSVVKTELNTNFEILRSELQNTENRLEDTFEILHGSGRILGLTPTIGSGLSINVSAGTALLGAKITFEDLVAPVEPNYSNGHLYLCQDSTFHVDNDGTPPSDKASFLLCTFVSDENEIISISTEEQERVYGLAYRTISGTFEDVSISESGEADYLIEHPDTSFAIPGLITVNVSPGFYIELPYPGFLSNDSDTEEEVPFANGPTWFWIRIVRRGGYSYEAYPTVNIAYKREGLVTL